jgi:uncharacterized membrane protein YphA (DoxX/SURF4 family)
MNTRYPTSNGLFRFAFLFKHAASHLQSVVLLIIRLAWGWELYLSGYRHLTHFSSTVEFFQSLHIPMPSASVAISGATELVGGLLLMAGLGARFISLPLVLNFCVAYATASIDSLKQFAHGGQYLPSRRYGPGRLPALEAIINDDAFPFLVTSLLMIAFGAGKISFDYVITRWMFRGLERPVESANPASTQASAGPGQAQ